MKLQIHTGIWRNIVEFDDARLYEVQDAAASLSRAVGGLQLRIVDDQGDGYVLSEAGSFRPIRRSLIAKREIHGIGAPENQS